MLGNWNFYPTEKLSDRLDNNDNSYMVCHK